MFLYSIIIPVFNVENYLRGCLDSIFKQSFKDFELILVNDGSTDSSGQICKEYAQRNENIIYIEQDNQGVAAARNNGLLRAKGQYIVFVDSDDYLFYNKAFEEINQLIIKNNYPDVILHEESRFFYANDIVYVNNGVKIPNEDQLFKAKMKDLVFNELFVASPCDKIIKREILIDNNIFFPIGFKSEDMAWSADLIPLLETFVIYDKSFYMYRQLRAGSAVASVNEKHLLDVYEMIAEGLQKVNSLPSIYKQPIENYWAEHYVFLLMNYYILSKEARKKITTQIEDWEYLIKEGATLNVDKVVKAYKWTSLNVLIMLLNNFRYFNKWNKKVRLIK